MSAFQETPTGLELVKQSPTFQDFELQAAEYRHRQRMTPILIGDLLNFCEEIYGDKFLTLTALWPELMYSTLANYKSVTKAVPRSVRPEGVTFAKLEAVRHLRDKPEVQSKILSHAVVMELNTSEMIAAFPEYFPKVTTDGIKDNSTPNLPEDWSGLYSLAIQLLERMLKMACGKQRDAVRLAAEALRDAQNGT